MHISIEYALKMGAEGMFCSSKFQVKLLLPPSLPPCLPACLPVCLPACLSACLPVCLPASLPACLSASPKFYLPHLIFYVPHLIFYVPHLIFYIYPQYSTYPSKKGKFNCTVLHAWLQGQCRSGVHCFTGTGKIHVEYWRGYVEY